MKIAFASCSKIQNQKIQPAWKAIEDENPDHLLLLGDNVYSPWWRWSHRKMKKKYQRQFKETNFKSLIQKVPFNAIWDDHDFGPNNIKGAHVSEKRKKKSLELFHRYMNCSTNLPYVYHSFEIGDVKVIMLDVRYYREKPHFKKDATILGVAQEQWLEQELQHSKKYTIVCSGSCLTNGTEKLEKYDSYYPKLCSLLKGKERTLFLSGDIHENEFVEHDGFYEAISSGVGRDNLNNYGIINFEDDKVSISLHGTRARDNKEKMIESSTWSLL